MEHFAEVEFLVVAGIGPAAGTAVEEGSGAVCGTAGDAGGSAGCMAYT